MYYRLASALLLVSVLAIVACDNSNLPSEIFDDPSLAEGPKSTNQSAMPAPQLLAKSFAQAMADAEVRQRVLQDMRASKWTEHKLILQDYLDSPSGGQFLDAAARASGRTTSQLRQFANDYPPLDFYVPVDEQRRSWTGTDEILVATILDPDGNRALAFSPDGRGQTLTTPEVPGVDAVFVIHGAESKSRHEDRDLGEGATIEDATQSESTFELSSVEDCGPNAVEDCLDSGTASDPATVVTRLRVDFEDGAFLGDAEVFWKTTSEVDPTTVITSPKVEGLDPCVIRDGLHVEIFNAKASPSLSLTAVLWEDDSPLLGGSDDRQGQAEISGPNDYISLELVPPSPNVCGPFNDVRAQYTVITED